MPTPGRATIRWYGDRQAKGLEEALFYGLMRAAAHAEREVKKAISSPSRTGGGGRRRPGRGRNRGKPMRFSRSKPGQPPKRDTGKLLQSIQSSGDRRAMMAVVATMKKYGVYLEKGANVPPRVPVRKRMLVFGIGDRWVFTKFARGFRLAARPYLWATVRRERAAIAAIIQREAQAFSAKGGVTIG